jgi:hypothetical protein
MLSTREHPADILGEDRRDFLGGVVNSRQDFGRIPIARPYDDDTIFIPAIPDHPWVDDNSPLSETEVRFTEDENARHKSIYFDFHNNQGERELEIVCGFCPIRREILNSAIAETESVHGPLKALAVTMAVPNARAHALFFAQAEFKRSADRSRTTWTYLIDIEERRQRSRQRPKRVKLKKEPEPKPTKTHLEQLEAIRDQYVKDGLKQVPQRLLDEIQAEKELQEKTARIEEERTRVKQSPEYQEQVALFARKRK